MKSILSAAVFAVAFAAVGAAQADSSLPGSPPVSGVCHLTPADLIGANWGYASQGTALANNLLGVAAGNFSQVGVASGLTAVQSGTTITGTWSTTTTVLDSRGVPATSTQPGTFTVNTQTCTGDFYWNATKSQIIFRAVFVDEAQGFRSISMVPGVFISFSTGSKF